MKVLLTSLLISGSFYWNSLYAQTTAFLEDAQAFFTTYVQHDAVQYQDLYHTPKILDALKKQIKETSLANASVQEQKAFYINSYNILVVATVVDRYPIASPNEISNFWDGITYTVAGLDYTLEGLETHLIETFNDPRLHFVLSNATLACPPIADFAYNPTQLEEQLQQRVIRAVNRAQWIHYQPNISQVELPMLFKRHRGSFQPTVLEFLNAYRVEKIARSVHVTYTNEDWSLNSYAATPSSLRKKQKTASAGAYAGLAQVITLPKGVTELNDFNSIYTISVGDETVGSRNTYFNSYFTAFYGVTGKLDIGMSLLFRSSRERDDFGSSPFSVLRMERTPSFTTGRASAATSIYADFGLSHMGFQVRFAPFKNINLSFEQGFMLPIRNLPKENTVDQSIYSVTQVYYIHPITSQLQLFFALTYWQGIRPGEQFNFQIPLLRGFLNYFATPRFSVFATSTYFLEWGGGVKYLLTPKFEIQFMYSYYLPIPGAYDLLSPGANSIMTYNMGLRYRF